MIGYWVLLAAGVCMSAVLFIFRTRRAGYSPVLTGTGFLAGFAMSVFLSKALYVALHFPSLTEYGAGKWVRFIPEEFSFVAGCIGFCLGAALVFHRRRKDWPGLMDQLAVPGCLLAAAARLGEAFLGMAEQRSIVGLTDLFRIPRGSAADWFPLAVPFTRKYSFLCVSTISALLILILGGLTFLRMRQSGKGTDTLPKGIVFEHCAFLLCAERLFLELGSMKVKFYFVHVDQALCALVILGLMIRAGLRAKEKGGRFPAWPYLWLMLCVTLNGLTQFVMDKPGKLERLLPESAYLWFNDHVQIAGFTVLLATTIGLVIIYYLLNKRYMQKKQK